MNTREVIQKTLSFEKCSRVPMVEWATWWPETIKVWHKQGLPENVGAEQLFEYFGLDKLKQVWFSYRTKDCPKAKTHGAPIILNDSDYTELKKYLYPGEDHIKAQVERFCVLEDMHKAGDIAFWYTLSGFFWWPRTLLGIENHLYSFYDEPELYHRICSDMTEYIHKILDILYANTTPEFMTFAEDMSYNNGPMISEELFEEFLTPYYQQIIPRIKEKGTKVIMDSDGDITKMIPWAKKAGIEGFLPLERQAGVDLNHLRELYPDLLFIGGFDKLTMPQGEAAMRAEFERLLPVMKTGGFIPSVDHQTPPQCSLENYRIYLRLLAEYTEKAAK